MISTQPQLRICQASNKNNLRNVMKKTLILINVAILFQLAIGSYIKPIRDNKNKNSLISESEWSVFKNKLGLTDSKVEILKTQEDQKATAELLRRYMKENPKYLSVDDGDSQSHTFHNVYKDMIKQLQSSKSILRASLNFELADNSLQKLKRSRRKIAVKMISDIPSEKIDELLKMFNEDHGLNRAESHDDLAGDEGHYDETAETPITPDADYLYENLWEDESPNSAGGSPQLGSFQDLIIKANRQLWQREMKDAKFRNEHFF